MKYSKTCFRIVAFAIMLMATVAVADDEPEPSRPMVSVTTHLKGHDYDFTYKMYAKPVIVDVGPSEVRRDTPFHTALSFFRVLKHMRRYDEVLAIERTNKGGPVTPPKDTAGLMEAARTILKGDIILFGEIAYGENRIYIYRYKASIPRNLGLAVHKIGGRNFIIPDLIEGDDLARRLSALRWDVERLRALHPPR